MQACEMIMMASRFLHYDNSIIRLDKEETADMLVHSPECYQNCALLFSMHPYLHRPDKNTMKFLIISYP